jgi:hypothetical protein
MGDIDFLDQQAACSFREISDLGELDFSPKICRELVSSRLLTFEQSSPWPSSIVFSPMSLLHLASAHEGGT